MKMVKSLLLGSAAGLVAVGGAQAADLPVKAKPVEYVKVCSLYGAGYYYIPGTDVCMHLGGYVRQEWVYGYGDNATSGPWITNAAQNTRIGGARDLVWRTRAYITEETRQQTAYGTLRTYLNVGLNGNNTIDFNANRAFIQIAGFTVGLASSYFDHYSVAAIAYLVDQSSDTGDGGRAVFAYTWQLGNGVSASIAAEEPESKRAGVWNTSLANPTLGIAGTASPLNDTRKSIAPDGVANVRIDGAWGSAQVMAAVHEASGGYYAVQTAAPTATATNQTLTGSTIAGYPSDTYGWAVGAGLRVNFPMIGPGDYFAAQAAYTEGAVRYISNTIFGAGSAGFAGGIGDGANPNTVGYGLVNDGVFCGSTGAAGQAIGGCAGANTQVQLTTAWGIAGGYEHFWTPSLRTSLHGSYVAVRYNATANALLCAAQTSTSQANTLTFTSAGCNQNYNIWQIGSRSQWNITKDFYIGVDLAYYRLETASAGATMNYTALAGQAQPTFVRTIADQDAWAGRLRWHRDLP